jgi:hypothetical protein
MSATNVIKQRDRVVLVTDAAAFDGNTGIIVGFPTKAAAILSWPGVLATRGNQAQHDPCGDDRRDRWQSQTCQSIVSHSTFCAWRLSRSDRHLEPPLSAVSKITDLQYRRHRAQEARKLADELTDPDAKCKMLKIAEDYEKLSIQAVQRLRHHSSATIRNWRR